MRSRAVRRAVRRATILFVAACGLGHGSQAEEASSQPKAIPSTRQEMKQAIERLKQRQPRLPMPTAEQRAAISNGGRASGGRPVVNNGAMRAHYLPASWQSANRGQQQNPELELDYAFKTRLFWIVSRANNCHYCLGHQEHKLLTAGMLEDEIAALDIDWQQFSPADRAALAFARKLTVNPHEIRDADFQPLRQHFTDRQIVEIVFTIASNNSTNRWTDSLGIPQDRQFRDEPLQLDTPTAERYAHAPSTVIIQGPVDRGELPSSEVVTQMLAECRQSEPRVALLPLDQLPAELATPAVTWVRALGYFPDTAAEQRRLWDSVTQEGLISPRLKGLIRWTTARENRAWYSTGHAAEELLAQGLSLAQVLELEKSHDGLSPAEVAAVKFAAKLTREPQQIADADVAALRSHFPDHEVAEVVFCTCLANSFDRFTSALALPLE